MVTKEQYFELMMDRPLKFTEEEVGYQPAPEGSAMICSSCINYYKRARDGHAVCQIMRSAETDENGVAPDWRCSFYTTTGDAFPFQEEEKVPDVEDAPAEDESDFPF